MSRSQKWMLIGFGLIHTGVMVSGVAALFAQPWRWQ